MGTALSVINSETVRMPTLNGGNWSETIWDVGSWDIEAIRRKSQSKWEGSPTAGYTRANTPCTAVAVPSPSSCSSPRASGESSEVYGALARLSATAMESKSSKPAPSRRPTPWRRETEPGTLWCGLANLAHLLASPFHRPCTPPPPPPTAPADMPAQPPTVPCQVRAAPPDEMPADKLGQYRTGRTLGSGTYAIVKEAVHIKTGEHFACKVINKKLMEGREYMVRNEIAVLKRVSKGHKNIVTLHDYFETAHNLYLCFDLCTGGELFDRICAKGFYYEPDAAALVRTIMGAVKYIHDCGIVHRDLKPENLLFRTKDEDADIMIADFGLSRVMEAEKLQLLTEICGTPGYMAPEIFKKTGHSKPVDIWAMGVITYFLLCGYTPFDRDTQHQEMEAIIAGDYKFEPEEYWASVSETARSFVSECLTIDPGSRPTAEEMLNHKWLSTDSPHFVPGPSGGPTNLLPQIQKQFNARKTFRKAVFSMMAMKRMSVMAHMSPSHQQLGEHIQKYKEESEKEMIDEDRSVMHFHHDHDEHPSEDSDDVSRARRDGATPLVKAMEKASIDDVSKQK